MTRASLIDMMAAAIARMEGYYQPHTLAQLNHNPGNLRQWGEMPTKGGFAVFPTAEAGFNALKTQIRRNIERGLTMYEFFGGKPKIYGGYAPDTDGNHSKHYAEFVAQECGIAPDAVLLEVTNEVD